MYGTALSLAPPFPPCSRAKIASKKFNFLAKLYKWGHDSFFRTLSKESPIPEERREKTKYSIHIRTCQTINSSDPQTIDSNQSMSPCRLASALWPPEPFGPLTSRPFHLPALWPPGPLTSKKKRLKQVCNAYRWQHPRRSMGWKRPVDLPELSNLPPHSRHCNCCSTFLGVSSFVSLIMHWA